MRLAIFISAISLAIATFAGIEVRQDPQIESIRKQAVQSDLSATDTARIFQGLRAFVLTTNEPADARCTDALLALRLICGVDRTTGGEFAGELMKAPWIAEANLSNRTLLRMDMSLALFMAGNVEDSKQIKKLVQSEAGGDRNAQAGCAILDVAIAQAEGAQLDEILAGNSLSAYIDDPAVSLKYRQEAAAIRLQTHLARSDVATEEDETLAKEAIKFSLLANDETANYLRLAAESVDLMPIRSDIIEKIRVGKKAKDRSRSDKDIEEEIMLEIDGRNIELRDLFLAERQNAEKRFGKSSRSYAKASFLQALATLNVSHQDKEVEARIMEETRECLEVATAPKGLAWSQTDGVTGIWMRYYDRIHRSDQALRVYKESASSRLQSRIPMLCYLFDVDPELVAHDWLEGMTAFADNVRKIALYDPDKAITTLSSWKYNWTLFETLPQHDKSELFMEGYAQATGIVRNVPYGKKASSTKASNRIYGPVGLDEIQNKLSTKRQMVVYVRFDEPRSTSRFSYGAFLLKGGRTIKYVSLKGQEVDEAIAEWEASMRGPDIDEPAVGDPRHTGSRLYDLLLKPLIGSQTPPELILVPDGKIGLVSFASLVTPRSKWLVEETTLRYLGAMRDVASTSEGSGTEPRALYATKFSSNGPLEVPTKSIAALRALDKETVATYLTPKTISNLRHPRILQISTHGRYDGGMLQDPLQVAKAAWIWVPDGKKDIQVTSSDVAKWDLQGTRLAILGSCDGGRADVLSGEGTGGLRRALFLAGARQVIAAQSYVYRAPGDKSPGDLLISYVYEAQRKDKDAARCLRDAQRRMIAAKTAPYIWAGFLCEGV